MLYIRLYTQFYILFYILSHVILYILFHILFYFLFSILFYNLFCSLFYSTLKIISCMLYDLWLLSLLSLWSWPWSWPLLWPFRGRGWYIIPKTVFETKLERHNYVIVFYSLILYSILNSGQYVIVYSDLFSNSIAFSAYSIFCSKFYFAFIPCSIIYVFYFIFYCMLYSLFHS